MDDFLAGPEHIFSILESALPEVRSDAPGVPRRGGAAERDRAADAVGQAVAQEGQDPGQPGRDRVRGWPAASLHQLKAHDPEHHRRPQINVATQDARWFSLCRVDGVTVTTADGRGVVYRQRDREKMFELLRESLKRQARLARKFNRMRKVYREALPVLTSKQKWETVLLPSSGQTRPRS